MNTAPTFPNLFRPLDLGPFEIPNRILMGSMHTGLEGQASGVQRLARFYARRAEGGVGLIVTGGHAPNNDGNLGTPREEMASAEDAALHKPISAAVHAEGGRIALQILHAGRYSYHDHSVAPSALRSPINRTAPRAMDESDIEATIEAYAVSAAYAREAGYDGVEIMGSEGYLISQFLAERTNQREDAWGGTFENRLRFPLSVLRRVRARLGADALIIFRLSVLELVEGGMSGDEIVQLAQAAEEAGVNILNSGIGWHEARTPTIAQPVPYAGFVWATGRVKKVVNIPVVASNKIHRPSEAEAVLAAGDADLISMARPFLADPDFVVKAEAGDSSRINVCIACNQACLDHYFEGKSVTCLVNPAAAREDEFKIHSTSEPRRIAVIGGGVAGLAAAATAARRGHMVTVYERQHTLGGQFKLAAKVPGKEVFDETISYYQQLLEENGVTLVLGVAVEPEDLLGEDEDPFDAVIVATGVSPRRPNIPGLETHPNVLTYPEALQQPDRVKGDVAVLGAGGIGYDVSLALLHRKDPHHQSVEAFNTRWGINTDPTIAGSLNPDSRARKPDFSITLMKRSEGSFGKTLGRTTGWVHRLELLEAGVKTLGGITYRRISPEGIFVSLEGSRNEQAGEENAKERFVKAETIILCTGQVSTPFDSKALEEAGIPVYVVGGARFAGELDAKRAIEEGTRAALGL